MEEMIAYCGLRCDGPARVAYATGDRMAKREIAEQWATDYPRLFPNGIDPEQVRREGCKGDEDVLFFYCRDCRIRSCASARGHDTCATCEGYRTCDALTRFYANAPEPKAVLDAIREGRPHLGIKTFT